jgi:hypothetical protein
LIELRYWTTSNGDKITKFLEEGGLPYRIVPVEISAGDQFAGQNAEPLTSACTTPSEHRLASAPHFSLGGSRD